MKPFIQKELIEPRGIEKILKKVPEENFLIDLNNLLAEKSLDEVFPDQIQIISQKYKLQNASEKFNSELLQMLNEFLSEHLGKRWSKFNDFQSAMKMKEILGISDLDFGREYRPKAKEVFRTQVSDTLNRTKKRDDEEDAQFELLRTQLGLTENDSIAVLTEVLSSIIHNALDNLVQDNKYSPDEKEAFEKLCHQLNVNSSFDDATKKRLDELEKFWQIENGVLPEYETDIILQKNEICHYKGFAKMYETRKKTKNVQYSGPVVRFKITKSLYYRAAKMRVNRETQDMMTLIDSGNLYVTNKRILFVGSKNTKTIAYTQIINLEPYIDGVEIIKSAGYSPTFQLDNAGGELLTATIVRIIQDKTT